MALLSPLETTVIYRTASGSRYSLNLAGRLIKLGDLEADSQTIGEYLGVIKAQHAFRYFARGNMQTYRELLHHAIPYASPLEVAEILADPQKFWCSFPTYLATLPQRRIGILLQQTPFPQVQNGDIFVAESKRGKYYYTTPVVKP